MPGHWMGVPLISVRILLDAGLSDADIARLLSCPLGTVVSCRCFYCTSERQSDPEPFLTVLDTSQASTRSDRASQPHPQPGASQRGSIRRRRGLTDQQAIAPSSRRRWPMGRS